MGKGPNSDYSRMGKGPNSDFSRMGGRQWPKMAQNGMFLACFDALRGDPERRCNMANDEIARRFHLDPALVRQSQERASDPLGAKALDLVGRMARMGAHITYEKARAIIEKETGGESDKPTTSETD